MYKQRKEIPKGQLSWWRRLRISELGLRIVLVGFILVGGLAYIVFTNSVATRGLQVKDLADRLETLSAKREVLQAEADRLQSLQHLDRLTKNLDFVRVSRVEYVTGGAGSVAAR
ncbi:MAG: hypothetical protein HY420_04180 [Candidatus Kerfeldbacteria bacterium]|nr:hypothetical protein [Candidatus Kerfeldbacteria bacterium]